MKCSQHGGYGAWPRPGIGHIETYSGIGVAVLDLKTSHVLVPDIAHALALQCRFAGHTRVHYSVGEHSVRVSRLLGTWGYGHVVQAQGLLHDAFEAYLVDVPAPLKESTEFRGYVQLERNIMRTILQAFGLPEDIPAVVKEADQVLLSTEVRDLMHPDSGMWSGLGYSPLPERISPWDCRITEYVFAETLESLLCDT